MLLSDIFSTARSIVTSFPVVGFVIFVCIIYAAIDAALTWVSGSSQEDD